MMNKLLECVPNFSEGTDDQVLDKIAAAISNIADCWLLHIDKSPAANRTVMTFAGRPEAVIAAAFDAVKVAAAHIDMRLQKGVHPRLGATDVCPLVPLNGMTMAEAEEYAHLLAKRIGSELDIPVYLYENSQKLPYRKALPDIRKGQYEGLKEKMQLPGWAPDFGPDRFNEKSGAVILGARNLLVAFNISLSSKDIETVHWIAQRLRESGYIKSIDGIKEKQPGKLAKVRAIGWYMKDYEQAQVSFNLLDYTITSPLAVWEACKQLAAEKGITLAGSEVIGLIPKECLLEAGKFALKQQYAVADSELDIIKAAIDYLGLDRLKPFNPDEKILEIVLNKYTTIG